MNSNKKFLPFLLIVAAIVIGGVAVRAQNGTTPPDGDGGNIPAGGFSRGSFLTPPCALGEPNCVVWTGLTVNEDLLREFNGVSSYGLPADGSLLFVKQDDGNTFSLLGSTGSALNWFDDLFAGPDTSFVGSESRFDFDTNELVVDFSKGNQSRAEMINDMENVISIKLVGGETGNSFIQAGQTNRLIICNGNVNNVPTSVFWDGFDALIPLSELGPVIWPNEITPGLPVSNTCTIYSFFATNPPESTSVKLFGSYVENFQ